ncbi:MAG: hypothetical protein QMB92_06440 [Thiopseudomonas sp.]
MNNTEERRLAPLSSCRNSDGVVPLMSARRRQRGAVLILVLWLVAILTFLLAAFTASVKVERQVAADFAGSVRARASMLGVLNYLAAVNRVDTALWQQMLGEVFELYMNDTRVRFRVVPENAFVSLNGASAETLAIVLERAGVRDADAVAGAIVLRRSGGADARTGETLTARPWVSFQQMVRENGLDPDALQPYMHWFTVEGKHASLNPGFADPELLQLLGMDSAPATQAGDGLSRVQGRFGLTWLEKTSYRVQVEVSTGISPRKAEVTASFDGNTGYRIVRWNEYNAQFYWTE